MSKGEPFLLCTREGKIAVAREKDQETQDLEIIEWCPDWMVKKAMQRILKSDNET